MRNCGSVAIETQSDSGAATTAAPSRVSFRMNSVSCEADKQRRTDSVRRRRGCRDGGGLRLVVRRVSCRTKVEERLRSLTIANQPRLRLPSPGPANSIAARHGRRAPLNFP